MGGYVIDALYDHVNDIQKHVFEKGYVLNFTRAVNDIPMTCQGHVIGYVIGYVIGDAPD
jgi:hypothetical protein